MFPIEIGNPWYISEYEMLFRLVLAVVLGGVIGFEREHANHAAGFRTNILVCLGACLLMLLSIYGFSDFVNEFNVRVDPARLAAAVITGIGFLGAGTILITGRKISGLTTAASLWVVAAIGLAVGAGFYLASAAVTFMVFVTLWLFNKLEHRFIKNRKHYILSMTCHDQASLLLDTQNILNKYVVKISKLTVEDYGNDEIELQDAVSAKKEVKLYFHIEISHKQKDSMVKLLNELKQLEAVRWISYE